MNANELLADLAQTLADSLRAVADPGLGHPHRLRSARDRLSRPRRADGLYLARSRGCSAPPRDHLLALTPDALWQPAPGGNGTRTVYDYVKGPLLGSYGHVGEIAALKAMRDRRSE